MELQNGQRFVANFRYNAKPTLTTDPEGEAKRLEMVEIHSGDYGSFDSNCGQTMVGFVQSIPSMGGSEGSMTNHKIQCFHASQDRNNDIEGTESFAGSNVKFARITRHSKESRIIESAPAPAPEPV